MKIAIVGSRHFKDYAKFVHTVYDVFHCFNKEDEIVSGGADGTDSLAKRFANEFKMPYKEFLPKTGTSYAQKCFNRNKEIVEYAEAVLAFWDGRIEHCGTLLTMQLAVQSGKRMYAVGV